MRSTVAADVGHDLRRGYPVHHEPEGDAVLARRRPLPSRVPRVSGGGRQGVPQRLLRRREGRLAESRVSSQGVAVHPRLRHCPHHRQHVRLARPHPRGQECTGNAKIFNVQSCPPLEWVPSCFSATAFSSCHGSSGQE